jgi:hypothetical protein
MVTIYSGSTFYQVPKPEGFLTENPGIFPSSIISFMTGETYNTDDGADPDSIHMNAVFKRFINFSEPMIDLYKIY